MTDDSGHAAESPGDHILADLWTAGSHLAHAAGDATQSVAETHHAWDVAADQAHSVWNNLDH
jgi:hypothetical protein